MQHIIKDPSNWVADEIGLPLAVIRIAETIFEGLPRSDAIEFAKRLNAPGVIREGADVSPVQWQFLLWLNTTPEVNPGIADERVQPAIDQVVNDVLLPLSRGEEVSRDVVNGAVRNAIESARSAPASAPEDAEYNAIESAAESAASSARSAAPWELNATWSAGCAATSAEWAANGSPASYRLMAAKLIELLSEAP